MSVGTALPPGAEGTSSEQVARSSIPGRQGVGGRDQGRPYGDSGSGGGGSVVRGRQSASSAEESLASHTNGAVADMGGILETQGTFVYNIETASDEPDDLDILVVPAQFQVSASHPHDASSFPSASHARWVRRRTLSPRDEIVDQLCDKGAQRVTWAIHRPTRGWYMHLRSSAFPRGSRIEVQPVLLGHPLLQSIDHGQAGLSGTPLLLALSTRIQTQHLARARMFVPVATDTSLAPTSDSIVGSGAKEHEHDHERYTSITLDHAEEGQDAFPAHTTAREDDQPARKHARRRSAGISSTASSTEHLHHVSHSISRAVHPPGPPLPEESEPEDLTGYGDETDESLFNSTQTQVPRRARMVIVESSGRPSRQECSHGSSVASPMHSQSWAAWAKDALVGTVRAPLRQINGSAAAAPKGFSIWWVDPPRGRTGSESSGQQSGPAQPRPAAIEVLRFDDESPWWRWKDAHRGRIALQHAAVAALNIDAGMWISVSTASASACSPAHEC